MYRIHYKKEVKRLINLPSSKSVTHRALILGALNSGRTEIINPLFSEDTLITLEALKSFGAEISRREESLLITKPIGKVKNDKVFLGNSGSSARFLIPLVTHLNKPILFSGVEELHKRPFSELFSILTHSGMKIESENNSLPAKVYPTPGIKAGKYSLGKIPSSQIVSGIMMSSALGESEMELRFSEKVPSFPYINITKRMMNNLGLNVKLNDDSVIVKPEPINYQWRITCEKDMSAASYWCAYAMINNVEVIFDDLLFPTLQGDEKIFEIAGKLGSEVRIEKNKVFVKGKINTGLDWNCISIPDIVPTLALLGLFAPEPFVLRNVQNLQFKESNRINAIIENINNFGGKADYSNGVLTIYPINNFSSATIKTFDDHRIAMSFAIAGTRFEEVRIDNPDCVDKSYPEFWSNFALLKKN